MPFFVTLPRLLLRKAIGTAILIWMLTSLSLPASPGDSLTEDLHRATARYEAAVASAREAYGRAVEHARDRWDRDAFMNRSSETYRQAMVGAVDNFLRELDRIVAASPEPITGIEERRREVELALEEALRTAESPPAIPRSYSGRWHFAAKGEGELYLKGRRLTTLRGSGQTKRAEARASFETGDVLIFRVQSPFVYRSFRAAFVGDDGTILPITASDLRHGDFDPASVSAEAVRSGGKPASRGRVEPDMTRVWERIRLREDTSEWIGLAARNGWETFAYVVP